MEAIRRWIVLYRETVSLCTRITLTLLPGLAQHRAVLHLISGFNRTTLVETKTDPPSLLTAGRGCLRPLWLWKNDIGQNYGNYSFIVIKPTTTVCSRENLTLPWYFPTSYLQHSTAGISRNDWRLSSVYENKEQLINRTVWTELVSFCIWISLLSREIEWNLFLRCWDWCSWRLPGKLDNLPLYLRLY